MVPGAIDDALAFVAGDQATKSRFERVGRLVRGFESPFGLELLATVHWVATREGAGTGDEVIEKVYSWNDRKRRFTRRQIRLAFDVMQSQGWLTEAAQ